MLTFRNHKLHTSVKGSTPQFCERLKPFTSVKGCNPSQNVYPKDNIREVTVRENTRGYYVRAREERNQLKGEADGHRQ